MDHSETYCSRCQRRFPHASAKQQHIADSPQHHVCHNCSHKPDFRNKKELYEHQGIQHCVCVPSQDDLEAHMKLLRPVDDSEQLSAISAAPIVTGSVRKNHFETTKADSAGRKAIDQHGLLGRDLSENRPPDNDPRVFYNVSAPTSTFICGSQGSGKSHTLSTLLENCLLSCEANQLPRPLAGLVFHYDTFISDEGGLPCEAAWLSSNLQLKVRVLCPPTNITNMKRIYRELPNVSVHELRLCDSDLNTRRMMDLMAVSPGQNGQIPLYLHVVQRVLRDLRIRQQQVGGTFDYNGFKMTLNNETLTSSQCGPLQQRLDTLESFMVKRVPSVPIERVENGDGERNKSVAPEHHASAASEAEEGTKWTPVSGQLTIVDLSCPCITPEMACSLFSICLGLFLEQDTKLGRVIALDEAHKYMTGNNEGQAFTESLLSTIRLQRHLGVRVIISTQEPTISPRLLDLCTITIIHRFTSPDWLHVLRRHLAGGSDVFDAGGGGDFSRLTYQPLSQTSLLSHIMELRTGEALLFAPSAVVDVVGPLSGSSSPGNGVNWQCVMLRNGVMKIRVRQRITDDGGKSIMA